MTKGTIKSGTIFDIQRFCLHDGPGLRTVVFFKGCPLRCLWCSNPESQNIEPELFYIKSKCVGCYACLEACSGGCISRANNYKIKINHEQCMNCQKCAASCVSGALVNKGTIYTANEVVNEAIKDQQFFQSTGGGVTLSGGEILLQADFACEVIESFRQKGIHVAIETTGYGEPDDVMNITHISDLILYDIKHYDEKKHIEYTGVSNQIVVSNLEKIKRYKKKIIIRIPLIPGFNMDHSSLEGIVELLQKLDYSVVELLPFHQLGKKKYEYLGRKYLFKNAETPSKTEVERITRYFIKNKFQIV